MGNCLSDVDSTAHAVGGEAGGPGAVGVDLDAAGRAAALVTGAAAWCTTVEIRASCHKLVRGDVLSKSDPMAVLFELPSGRELGRTEVQAGTHDPVFTVPFRVTYNFEKLQRLRLLVVDIDENHDPATVNPQRCDFLGEAQFTLSELVTSPDHSRTLKLTNKAHANAASTVALTVEELSMAREVVAMQVAAQGLRNVELLSKSDPFLELCKSRPGGAGTGPWQPVYKTEVKPNNLNPTWAPLSIKASLLNNADPERPMLLRVMDFEAVGHHQLLGQLETTATKLSAAAQTKMPQPLSLPGKPGTQCGSLVINSFVVTWQPTFLDYVQAGTEISFVVAVDFTGSNRVPTDPQSLHYLNPAGGYTPYEHAMQGIGQVLEFYDSDRQYPAFGFGGMGRDGSVSHCFPLNGRPDGNCAGVAGIMGTYRQALYDWRLAGPTKFAPVVRRAMGIASESTPWFKYTVLLILTDGEIMDMPETVDAIVEASGLPMSVLIVGVGGAEFEAMHFLDSDKRRLRARNGRLAERDIVQFVEFRKFTGPDSGEALAAELLAELPGQFLQYVRSRNVPLPRPLPTAPPPLGYPAPGVPAAVASAS